MTAETPTLKTRRRAVAGRAVRRHVADMPRAFWFLWWGQLVNKLGSVVVPFLALYLTGSLGRSTAQAGLFITLFGLGGLGSQLVGGVLADRVGRRITLSGGLVAASCALFALGFARGDLALGALCVATGFTVDLYRPASSALVADLVAPESRVRAYGLLFWAINLGWAVATTMGGLLASHSFRLLFSIDAATCFACAIVVWRGVPETHTAAVRAAHRSAGAEAGGLKTVLRDRTMLALVAVIVLESAVYMQSFFSLPIVMHHHGLGPAAYGVVIAVNGVVIVALQPFAVTRTAQLPRARVLAVSQVITAVGFSLTTVCRGSAVAYAGTVVIWTLGEILQAGLLTAVVADLAPAALRGRYLGVFGFSFAMAAIVSPLAGSQLLSRAGETGLWLGVGNAALLGGVAMLVLEPALTRRGAAGLPMPSA